MYLYNDLKSTQTASKGMVDCVVKGCGNSFPAPTSRSKQPKCNTHNIKISKESFIHVKSEDNSLWQNLKDLNVLKGCLHGKRFTEQFGHEKSEDAVTWNVFRYLENHNMVSDILNSFAGTKSKFINPMVLYYSYYQTKSGVDPDLINASNAFREKPSSRTEPDLIIYCDDAVVFVEAKFTSNNDKPGPPKVAGNYMTGCNNLWSKIFCNQPTYDFKLVCINEKRYQLARMWLLGNCVAQSKDKDFYLIYLIRQQENRFQNTNFSSFIQQTSNSVFLTNTWQQIESYVATNGPSCKDTTLMIEYFEEKTAGYKNRKLQKAFYDLGD